MKSHINKIFLVLLFLQAFVCKIPVHARPTAIKTIIVLSKTPGLLEYYAAREIRRYLYLRTGELLPIQQLDCSKLPSSGNIIVIGPADSPFINGFSELIKIQNPGLLLKTEEYWLKTFTQKDRKIVLLTGKEDFSTLYAAYKFMENYGIRYTPAGDIIPDGLIAMNLPEIDKIFSPQFMVRGMLPYHSWNPEGPENWNEDAYKSFLTQQVKMGMNFIGLIYDFSSSDRRTYIFPPEKKHWEAGDYWIETPVCGANQAMKSNLYGSDRWLEARKLATPEEQSAYMKQANMKFMAEVFSYAHLFNVKCAIGAENRGDQQYFDTVFNEIGGTVKPDYFWISSPETWSYSSPPQNTTDELLRTYKAALAARKTTNAAFEIASMGWALGPQNDPLVLDRNLPKELIMSAQNLNVGKGTVQPEWGQITGRKKWVIPWMEDDFNLLSPQLWVKRTIENAADAKKYGCEGLIGVHWRTKTLTPQMMTLAILGWDNQLNAQTFYTDFAVTNFGNEAAHEISSIFQSIDSQVPEVSQWLDMWPGGLKKDSTYWTVNQEKFAFVDQLENLRLQIKGKGNLERFDYYLNQFKYLRGMAKLRTNMGTPKQAESLHETMNSLIQSASTIGEIGNMLCISRQLGKNADTSYTGQPHLIVLTPRTSLLPEEDLNLDVFFIDNGNPQKVDFFWKSFGEKKFRKAETHRQQRNHFTITLAADLMKGQDIEYYIKGTTASNQVLYFPATAPESNFTVIKLTELISQLNNQKK
jgi:hypothetical protein